ncbi:hypothetical protein OY671_009959, partial [Metschnikowia pulcherrima]
AADQCLRPGGGRGARVQARFGAGAGPAQARAMARNLRVQSARGRHPLARRAGGARRPASVRPARRFPHRNPGTDEGAAREERGDRADRGQGRVLSQAVARSRGRSRWSAGGRQGQLPGVHPHPAFAHRQHRRRQGGPSQGRGDPRRRRPLFRGRGGQGHGHVLRRRQRHSRIQGLSARRRFRQRWVQG